MSTGGGDFATWSASGRELTFVTADGRLMASEIQTTPAFHATVPRELFRFPRGLAGAGLAGQRILCLVPVGEQRPTTHTVVLNWAAGLKAR